MKKLLAGAAICILLGGCSAGPTPGGSSTPGGSKPSATASASAKPSSTPSASASATPSASPSATGSPTAAATDWQTFKAPDGSFEVAMPGKPIVQEKDGQMVVVATLGDNDHKLGLVKHTKKTGIKSVKDLSEEAVGAIIKEMEADGSKVTKHDTGEVQGHPALNLVVTMSDKTVGDMVMVFTDEHMYQLMTLRPEKSEPFKSDDETKFAQSFKISEKAGGAKQDKEDKDDK